MLPSRNLHIRLLDLIVHDVTTIRDPSVPLLSRVPVGGPFVPTPTLVLDDLTIATSAAPDALTTMGSTNNHNQYYGETQNQLYGIRAWPSANQFMFFWDGTGEPPTIYGDALIGDGRTKLYGVEMYPNPITLTTEFQTIFPSHSLFIFPDTIWK